MDSAKVEPDAAVSKAAEAKPATASKSKTKGKATRFVYLSDISPEEKMASLAKYAFSA
jgi:hypothetical protein